MNFLAENSVVIIVQTRVAVHIGNLSRRITMVDSTAGITAAIITRMNVRAAYLTDNGTVEESTSEMRCFFQFSFLVKWVISRH